MIIYLCIKYESNTLISSKDIEWKPLFIRKGWQNVYMDSEDTICPHPIANGRGIKKYTIFSLFFMILYTDLKKKLNSSK